MGGMGVAAFVGRRTELDRLDAASGRAAAGEPRVVLIGGDAGIGKTRLIREFLAGHGSDTMVATGGCVPVAGGSLPYVPFVEILRELGSGRSGSTSLADVLDDAPPAARAELARLAPALRPSVTPAMPADDPLARSRLFEAVLAYLVAVSSRVPLQLVIEDLHWADGSSLDLLGYLVRNLRGERILVLATYRTDELHRRHPLRPWLAEIARLDVVERLDLAPLRNDDLRLEVAALLGPAADPPLVDRIVERASGNPLFATELVAVARGGANPNDLPDSLRAGFVDRLERLGPDALLVARHVAVIGRPASQPLLATSAQLDPARLTAAIREAVDARVLAMVGADHDGRFEPTHALLGEAIIDDLLPAERTSLHQRVADVLEAGGDDERDHASVAGEVAHHRWQAHDPRRAIEASARAAVSAAKALAYTEADGHWTRVLEAWAPDGPAELAGFDRPAALIAAADAAAAVGENHRAARLADRALDLLDERAEPLRAAEIYRHLMAYRLWVDARAVDAHTDRAVRLIPPGDPPPEAARILAVRAVVLGLRLHLDEAEAMARRALELAARHGRPDAEMEALMAVGNCLVSRSAHAAGLDICRRGFDLADRLGDAVGLMATGNAVAWTLNDAGLSLAALEHCSRFEARIAQLGLARRYGWEMHDHQVRALMDLGRWPEAEDRLVALLARDRLASEDRSPASASLARLRARQDRAAEARELATRAAADEQDINLDPVGWSGGALLEVALHERRWADARQIVADVFGRVPEPARPALPDLRGFAIGGLEAEAELAFEARIRRDAAAEAEAIAIARGLAAWAGGLADRVTAAGEPLATTTLADTALSLALLSRVERRPDPDAWRPALERYETLGHPYDIARTRRWLAEAILDAGGSRREAATELALAAAAATSLGAIALERQVRDLARRARLSLEPEEAASSVPPEDAGAAPGAGRPEPGSGWVERLTPREREVLGYLAAGWTNRRIGEALFISEKTASVHVSNLMGKLGAANRAEAALIGDRLGLIAPPADGTGP